MHKRALGDAMQVKDITDEQCKQAAKSDQRTIDALMEATGAPWKVCARKLEKLVHQGKMDYGVSLGTAWWND